jgi:membrane protein implicated in regulation of membrane protease activity
MKNTIVLWTVILAGFALLVVFPGFFLTASILAMIAVPLWVIFSMWTWENTANAFGPPLVFEALRKLLRH